MAERSVRIWAAIPPDKRASFKRIMQRKGASSFTTDAEGMTRCNIGSRPADYSVMRRVAFDCGADCIGYVGISGVSDRARNYEDERAWLAHKEREHAWEAHQRLRA